MGKAKLVFTKNEAVALAHEDRAAAFRRVVEYVKKTGVDMEYLLGLLEEMAEEADAQALVVRLRDEFNL